MRPGRTLPPAAAPIGIAEMLSGICGIFHGQRELERFRSELREHFGVKHCFLVSSGQAAFAVILLSLKELFPDRDEVLIPAFTCYSVPSSVLRAGLRIRLCDLHPESLDFDFAQLTGILSKGSRTARPDARSADIDANFQNEAVNATDDCKDPTKKLLAVVPTHLFGFPSDIPRLRQLLRDPGATIVEDAAQAMGETWEGRKLGTLGDVSFFSLGRGKTFSAVEGGVILTDRDDLAAVLNRRVNNLSGYGFGQSTRLVSKAAVLTLFTRPSLFWIPRSVPFLKLGETHFESAFPILRMSSFQAGLTLRWRERLRKFHEVRKKNVNRWMTFFEATGNQGLCFSRARSLGLLRFPIRVRDDKNRKALLQDAASKYAGVMPVYPQSINRLVELRGKILPEAFPVAESCARELITLPTHVYVDEDDVRNIGNLVSRSLA
jgi:perosamine synthetase